MVKEVNGIRPGHSQERGTTYYEGAAFRTASHMSLDTLMLAGH